MKVWPGIAVVALVLAGCGIEDSVPQLETIVAPLDTFSARSEGLDRILRSDDSTPGKQSLLYVAIAESQAATGSANRALALANQPVDVMGALGETAYAVDPSEAPAWAVKQSGLVPRWQGLGYGVRPATETIIGILRGLGGEGSSDSALADALVCSRNTLGRAEQILVLAERYRATATPGARPASAGTTTRADAGDERQQLLARIAELAGALNRGRDIDGDGEVAISAGECGLADAERLLDRIQIDPGLA